MLRLNTLKPQYGSNHANKRLGRGSGSGHGPTAGKGDKGQLQRSGGTARAGFEGGQTPLYRRLPKRGFTNIHARSHAEINLAVLEANIPSQIKEIDLKVLQELGLAKKTTERLVVLANGDIKRAFKITAHRISEAAAKKITAAGGSVTILKVEQKVPRHTRTKGETAKRVQ